MMCVHQNNECCVVEGGIRIATRFVTAAAAASKNGLPACGQAARLVGVKNAEPFDPTPRSLLELTGAPRRRAVASCSSPRSAAARGPT